MSILLISSNLRINLSCLFSCWIGCV